MIVNFYELAYVTMFNLVSHLSVGFPDVYVFLECLDSVSYTHLDVYKRQAYTCLSHGTFLKKLIYVFLSHHGMPIILLSDFISANCEDVSLSLETKTGAYKQ